MTTLDGITIDLEHPLTANIEEVQIQEMKASVRVAFRLGREAIVTKVGREPTCRQRAGNSPDQYRVAEARVGRRCLAKAPPRDAGGGRSPSGAHISSTPTSASH